MTTESRSRLAVTALAPGDHAALATLLEEMQGHYGGTTPPRETLTGRLADLPPGVEILVVRRGDAVAGFASACVLFPGPGLVPVLFLKELYVAAAARGGGVAAALMRALARRARAAGCVRVDWTAEVDNAPARALYEGLGAVMRAEKIVYRLEGEALARAAGASADD